MSSSATATPSDAGALRPGDERVVDIGPVAHGGHFVAHSDGRTLFVRHALTGERARVRITEVTRKIVRADAVEIITASADRVPAPCLWSGPAACGGCDFQHVSLPAQRALKTQVLRESLRRFGRVPEGHPLLDVVVQELPGHADGLRWRTRMTWANGADGQPGLRRYRSHDVVPVDDCLIADSSVSRPSAAPPPARVERTVRDRRWRVWSDGFWQVHPALPEVLVETVLEFGVPQSGERWWDLYAGAGLFSAFLGEAVGPSGSVIAVEESAEALRSARRALHDLAQVSLQASDVGPWLAAQSGGVDGIVLDPPRSGAGAAVVAALAAQSPRAIVYVACDPVALSRDVALLAEKGYTLQALRSFDAFPMTHHLESVALFTPTA